MELGNMYVDVLEDQFQLARGWYANWPLSTPVALGDVGTLEENFETGITSFRPSNRLPDYGIPFLATPSTEPVGDLTLTYGAETHLEFGLDASLDGWKWLGNATAGFQAGFGSSGGLHAEFSDIRRVRIEDLDSLRDNLLDAKRGETLMYYRAVVVEVDTVDIGMILASTNSTAKVKVSTDVDLKPAQIKLVSFAGSFAVKSNDGSALIQPMTKPFTSAFRALVVGKRGIWWWKHIVIFGAADMSPEQRMEAIENELSDGDYLLMY